MCANSASTSWPTCVSVCSAARSNGRICVAATGRALIDAAGEITRTPHAANARIEGVDLAGLFDPNPSPEVLTLQKHAIEDWTPAGPYDLITCVHGLHYNRRQARHIAKATGCLAPGGLLLANLDVVSFSQRGRYTGGASGSGPASRERIDVRLTAAMDTVRGAARGRFGLRYLGADDTVGPNYTGQPAVASYYAR